jgi:hypothetical protein
LSNKNNRRGVRRWAVSLCVLTAGAVLSSARCEELALLAGQTDGEGQETYAWQIEYRQPLLRYVDASFSYVDEGHLLDHQRDGAAVQLWVVTPRWRDRVDFAIGVGPYVYFDTQFTPDSPWYRNYHSVAEIYTSSLTYYATESWFARLNLSLVHAPGDVNTRLALLGVGYRLGSGSISSRCSPGGPTRITTTPRTPRHRH